MGFRLSQEKTRFLQLALKKINGTATPPERSELDALMKATPDLKHHFEEISRQLSLDQSDEFLELCLRVLFNKGTQAEVSRIQALKQTDAERWREFLKIALLLDSIGESSTARTGEKGSPVPMPEAVRKRILAGLRGKERKR